MHVHPDVPENITETHAVINEMTLVTNKNESFFISK